MKTEFKRFWRLESGVLINIDAIDYIKRIPVPVQINGRNGITLQCDFSVYTRSREVLPATKMDVERLGCHIMY